MASVRCLGPVACSRWFALAAFLVAPLSPGKAQAPKAKPNPYVVSYDISDILKNPNATGVVTSPRTYGGLAGVEPTDDERAGMTDIHALARAIVDVLDGFVENIRKGTWRIREVNGTRLEIKASADAHEQVADLLEAYRRLLDVAVVLEVDLVEVDRKYFDTHVAGVFAKDQRVVPGRSAIVVDNEVAAALLDEEAEAVSWSRSKLPANGRETPALSFRTAFVYGGREGMTFKNEPDVIVSTAFAGVAFRVGTVVTADRREVRLKVVQDVADLVDIKKEKTRNRFSNKEIEIETPNLQSRSSVVSLKVEDGQTVVLPVDYRVPSGRDKDRLLVLILRPIVWIEAEQKELNKGNGP